MILYFADRQMNILGRASTNLPRGLVVVEDKKTDDVELGVSIFECKIPYDDETRADVTAFTEVGNYLLRSHEEEREFYTIIETETDTKNQEVYIYAEDSGMDLLNEVVGAYEADKAYNVAYYINKYAAASGFEVGKNEISSLTRKLVWDGEQTAAERILSVATQFDNAEISYSFDVDNLYVTKKYINIYKKRERDLGVQLRLNKEIDSIVTTKSIANIATALQCTGGTPENSETPITLKNLTYDDGDFYVDGTILKSREALKKWNRLLWRDDEASKAGGHITKQFSYDTLSPSELCSHAITELKKLRDAEVNYEAEIVKFPVNAKIGDRVNIVDDAGNLYLSARLLTIETSVADNSKRAVLGEYLLRNSGISEKVAKLAEQFAKNSQSAARALMIANNATASAEAALEQVEDAMASVEEAQKAVQEVVGVVDDAREAAELAQAAANNAQSVVDNVEKDITALEISVANANAAAELAQQAAVSAETKATEAKTAASNAQSAVNAQAATVQAAQKNATEAKENASAALSAAQNAQIEAEAAATTAEAAKLDAKRAQAEIDSLGNSITTIEETMAVEYARKTDLTETEAYLQTQITRNAAGLSSVASSVERIDETTNNALEQLEGAIEWAEIAQAEADAAQAKYEEAQAAADEAQALADEAQAQANTAQAAADDAKEVADNARAALEAAIADFETILDRADATEAEIAQAEVAVANAQAAADTAVAQSKTAASEAARVQLLATQALAEANIAQAEASLAFADARKAQMVADEALGDATAAQAQAAEAIEIANAAALAASEAVAEAREAQASANALAETAQDAQFAADEAQRIADNAAADLEEAQARFEQVQADAEATEEELANAQAAVEAAQTAATQAQAEADAAQALANEAKANAETAQNAADEAQIAAEEAQAEADAANEAVTQAQAIVHGLSERITDAETKISQTSKELRLAATKTEVKETLGGYYTKKETDAAIKVSADGLSFTVSDVNETASDAQHTANDAAKRVSVTESEILQLADMIATLVTDGDGASLMTQTEGKWTFSIGSIIDSLAKANEDIDSLSGDVDGANSEINTLKQAVNDLGVLADYVVITTYNGQPCIELGEAENEFKLRITNTEIQFADGTIIPAYVSNKKLMIEQAEVKNELQFGGFVWKARANGNVGFMWKGVEG